MSPLSRWHRTENVFIYACMLALSSVFLLFYKCQSKLPFDVWRVPGHSGRALVHRKYSSWIQMHSQASALRWLCPHLSANKCHIEPRPKQDSNQFIYLSDSPTALCVGVCRNCLAFNWSSISTILAVVSAVESRTWLSLRATWDLTIELEARAQWQKRKQKSATNLGQQILVRLELKTRGRGHVLSGRCHLRRTADKSVTAASVWVCGRECVCAAKILPSRKCDHLINQIEFQPDASLLLSSGMKSRSWICIKRALIRIIFISSGNSTVFKRAMGKL